ncbi:uncharacterized protein LOC132314001 [Cornus florida]|uniref:uncharacterized protein LOC132314001 n=1 Tax=Cornus florida TaxID=4283 RepID=UPI002899B598|nr:uncharacterized protein LOC132314001 [Cornus florida]
MGFTQLISLPPYKSQNRYFDQRVRITDVVKFAAIDKAYEMKRSAFNFQGHTSKPQSSNEFTVWWTAYISSSQIKNHKAVCDSILASFKPFSPEKEILKESDEEESEENNIILPTKVEGVAESGNVSHEHIYSSNEEEEEVEEEEEEDALYKGLVIVKKEFQPQFSSSDEDSSNDDGISKRQTNTQHSIKIITKRSPTRKVTGKAKRKIDL